MKCDTCKKEIKRYRSYKDGKYCYHCYMKHYTRMPYGIEGLASDEEIENRIRTVMYQNQRKGMIILPSRFIGRKVRIKFMDKDENEI